ncbi:hypothetical protein [Fibrella aquatilis]|uniref:Uncharacterized protein n=1 Tax=Fibrella aquatilis TaxID=2817059 RepID=A0A939G728_9BACT|nr:hypothetical protein [Fibrella aquatilis]MBO0932413.1 hypothetical protein [Fibrella aquatilis]
MSTVETLHKVVDSLPEQERVELMQYIVVKYDSFLPPLSEEDKADYERLVGELLTKRYDHYKQSPETAMSAEESDRRIKAKYGW